MIVVIVFFSLSVNLSFSEVENRIMVSTTSYMRAQPTNPGGGGGKEGGGEGEEEGGGGGRGRGKEGQGRGN